MKFFITGGTGFVGKHLINYLTEHRKDAEIVCTTRKEANTHDSSYTLEKVDLNDSDRILELIYIHKPDYVIHLAAESSVGYSWLYPVKSFNNNINIYLNLLDAIRKVGLKCRILSIGSSESYGIVSNEMLPLKESTRLNPVSPYAVARVSQELLSKVYVEGYGMDIVMTRSFNHFGPFQDFRFVIPSFVKQIIERKQNNSTESIETGDLSIIRDFVDVRDVIQAYLLLLEKGVTGEIYNICKGKGYSLQNVIEILSDKLSVNIKTEINPSYIRPNDNPTIIGDNSKITKNLGWSTKYSFDESIRDVIDYVNISLSQRSHV